MKNMSCLPSKRAQNMENIFLNTEGRNYFRVQEAQRNILKLCEHIIIYKNFWVHQKSDKISHK